MRAQNSPLLTKSSSLFGSLNYLSLLALEHGLLTSAVVRLMVAGVALVAIAGRPRAR